MPYYVVRPGDHIEQIACRAGVPATEIWDHDRNQKLRALRDTATILHPGDLLFLPEREPPRQSEIRPGEHHELQRYVPTVDVRLTLRDATGTPLSNEPFRIEAFGGYRLEGVSDDKGEFHFAVRATLPRVLLRLTERNELYPITLGTMDPARECTGAQTRLRQLGFFHGPSDGQVNARTRRALHAFQQAYGLEPSGDLEPETIAKLREVAGC